MDRLEITPVRLGLFALVLLAAVFWPLWRGQFYAVGDIKDVFIPLEIFFHNEMLAGRLPAWQPDAAWGFPVIAAAQIGFFYPPLLVTRWLPVQFYLPLLVVAHIAALGLGLYFFLRHRGRSPEAAWLGSCAFTLSAFIFQHLTHLNIIFAVAWLPWQLLLVERRAKVGWLALALGIPFLAGQIQMPFLMAAFTAVYFLIHRYRTNHVLRRPLAQIVALIILTMALAAVQLVPTIELVNFSSRSTGGDFDIPRANQHSFPVYNLPTILFPHFFGHGDSYWGKRLEIEQGIFIGTIPLLLATFAARQWKKNRFWILTGTVAFLLALGTWSPFRLIGLEPSLWVFSAPARWLLFCCLSLSVLVAAGWDELAEKSTAFRRFAFTMFVLVSLGVVVINVLLFVFPTVIPEVLLKKSLSSTVSLRSLYTFLPLTLLAVTPWLSTSRRRRSLLLLLTGAELALIAATTTPAVSWQETLSPPTSIALLPQSVRDGQARLTSVRDGDDSGSFFQDHDTTPTDAKRREQHELLIPLIDTQYHIPGIMWPASLDFKEQYNTLVELRQFNSYEIKNYDLLRQLNVGAILRSTPSGLQVETVPAAPRASVNSGTAIYQTITPNHIQISVKADQADHVIVRDTWYPGWQATVDSQPTPVEKTDPFFIQITTPAGQHTIDITFRSPTLRAGMIISALGLVVALLSLLPLPLHYASRLFRTLRLSRP